MIVPIRKVAFNGGEWSPALQARIDLAKYNTAVKTMTNVIPRVSGGASNRGGTEYLGAAYSNNYKSRLVPFTFSTTQAYVLEFSNTRIRVIKDGGIVVYSSGGSAGSPVQITSPYAAADLPYLRFAQSFDTLYIVHTNYAPRKLTRTAHDAWTLSVVSFAPGISAPTGLVSYSSGDAQGFSWSVTAVSETGEESLPSSSVVGKSSPSALTWNAVPGAAYYNVYRRFSSSSPLYTVIGFLGKTSQTSYLESLEDAVDFSKTPPEEVTVFNTTNEYPSVVCFCEQRLVFGRTNSQPQTIFGSQTANFESFGKSSPMVDSDAYEHELNATKVNAIRWMLDLNGLLVGGDTAEIKVTGSGGAITPMDVSAVKRSYYGSNDLPPQVVGASVLIVTPDGNTVRALDYNYDTDAFNAPDLTILARHLLANYQITDWCYQASPNSTLWCVRNDGTLLGLTYDKDQEVIAWHKHETDGIFEAVATVVNSSGKYDLYAVVKRTINGSAKRYIELFREGQPLDSTTFERKVEDSFYLDCALEASSTVAFTQISGLTHLEGKTVNVLADGSVEAGKTVSSGAITLDHAAYKVVVGLPYEALIETLDFDTNQVNGVSIQNGIRGIKECVVRLESTRALQVGSNEDNVYDLVFTDDEDLVNGEPTPLFTGDKQITLDLDNYKQARMVFKSVLPLPFTVLGVFAQVDVEDNDQ